jgi:hypothetical protein
MERLRSFRQAFAHLDTFRFIKRKKANRLGSKVAQTRPQDTWPASQEDRDVLVSDVLPVQRRLDDSTGVLSHDRRELC